MIYIYCVTNLTNGKKYVGQTNQEPHKRFLGHCADARSRPKRRGLAAAIRKYGPSAFVVEQLTAVSSRDEANQAERRFIAFFDCLRSGYNQLAGGAGHRTIGNPHTKTEAWKLKMSALRKQLWANPESRNRMLLGRWGGREKKPRYRPASISREEHSAKIAESNKRRSKSYQFTDPLGVVHQVAHLPSFCETHHLDSTCMSRVASGKYSKHRGWRAA